MSWDALSEARRGIRLEASPMEPTTMGSPYAGGPLAFWAVGGASAFLHPVKEKRTNANSNAFMNLIDCSSSIISYLKTAILSTTGDTGTATGLQNPMFSK